MKTRGANIEGTPQQHNFVRDDNSNKQDIKQKHESYLPASPIYYKEQSSQRQVFSRQLEQMIDENQNIQEQLLSKVKHQNKIIFDLKNGLNLLQKSVKGKFRKSNKKQKRLIKQQQRYFSRIGYQQFGNKMRQIVSEANNFFYKGQQNQYEQNKSKTLKILKWLKKLIKKQDMVEFVQRTSQKFQRWVLISMIRILKNKRYLKNKSVEDQLKQNNRLINFFKDDDQNYKMQQIKFERQSHKIDKKTIMLAESHLSQFEPNKVAKIQSVKLEQTDEIKVRKVLRLKKPKCPQKSCKNQLVDRKCETGNHMIVICDQCGWNEHQCYDNDDCENKQKYFQKINFLALGQKVKNYSINRIKKTKIQNNIQEFLHKLKYQPIIASKYIPGMPKKIACNYPILAGQVWQQIYKNRVEENYLPLTIKKSTIKGAGFGVFTTDTIEKQGMLVCSYLGQIGTGSITPALRNYNGKMEVNNSFFTLGWLQKQILLMAPNLYSNVARFINYNSPSKCNLKASLCLVQTAKKNHEIAVFLTSTRRIRIDEQLFYNYGSEYSEQ